jgi:hypothetical protein
MTAALREILILDLYGIGANSFELSHRACHIERIAVAGISVDDEMRRYTVADRCDRLCHFCHAHETDVGPGESCIRDRSARHIKRGKPGLGCKERSESVINSRRDDDGLVSKA